MDMRGLARMVPPPPPEPAPLRFWRRLLASCLFLFALAVILFELVVALWPPLAFLYPFAAFVLLLATVRFFRVKSLWYERYWTEARRARHYARVLAGTAPPDRSVPPPFWRNWWRRR